MLWNNLCNFERGHHREHSCDFFSKFGPVVQENISLKKRFAHDGQTHDRQRPITVSHLEPLT